jgi:bacteriorhodopsin
VLLGATASFATGWDSVAYYTASFIVCMVLFVQAWYIFQEAIVRLPQKASPYILGMMLCFYLGWAGFGIIFAFGAEGWGPKGNSANARDNEDIVGILHSLCDILSKLAYGFLGWYLRWHVLRGKDGRRAAPTNEGGKPEGPPPYSAMGIKHERRRAARAAGAAGAGRIQRTVLLGWRGCTC